MLLSLLWTQLFSPAWAQIAGPGHFFFQWPTQTSQCQLVSLTWEDAVPPFSAWVIPLGQQPFIYDIPDSAYSGGSGQYDIQLQLNQGTNYVMLMSDGRGMGSGGTSNTQIVSSSPNTQCLDTAASNQTAKEFSFSVAGIARQCETGFELTWDGTPENAPYNFTVIPLQQGYYPFDVPISESSGWTKDWAVNMTEGTKFTVVMNNEHGYGTGGAAGIYEIANNTGGSSSCIQQSLQPTAVWPVGVATNTLPVATNSRRPGDNDSTGGGLAPGAIAGIVIGIIAVLALIAFLVWFIRRRKRRNADDYRGKEHNNLDLADGASDRGAGGYDDPLPADHGTVSPYISQNHTALPGESHSMTATPHRSDSGNRSENSASGFAGLGAASAFGAAAGGSGERSRQGSGAGMGHEPARDSWTYSHGDSMGGMGGMNMGYAMEDGDARAGPGIAPPLPPKGTPFRPSSSQPSTITGRPDSGYTQFTHHSNSMGHASKRDSSQTLQSRLGFGAGFGQTGSGAAPQLPPGAGAVGPGMPGVPGPNRGGMRIVNHDHPDDLPAVDPTAGGTSGNGTAGASGHGRRGQRNSDDFNNRRMEFRRHADAGRVDYVDLPPLYTDVPRDGGDAAVMRGPAQMEDMRGSSYGSGNSASPLPSADLRGGGGMSGNESPTSPHTPLLADVDPLSVNDPAGRGSGNGQRRSPLSR